MSSNNRKGTNQQEKLDTTFMGKAHSTQPLMPLRPIFTLIWVFFPILVRSKHPWHHGIFQIKGHRCPRPLTHATNPPPGTRGSSLPTGCPGARSRGGSSSVWRHKAVADAGGRTSADKSFFSVRRTLLTASVDKSLAKNCRTGPETWALSASFSFHRATLTQAQATVEG